MRLTRRHLRELIWGEIDCQLLRETILSSPWGMSGAVAGAVAGAETSLESVQAALDLWRQYDKMKSANTRHSDKYFHCLAHCLATSRGGTGETLSHLIGWAREVADSKLKGDTSQDVTSDEIANSFGRAAAESGSCGDCWRYIPNGLPEEYWVLPDNVSLARAREVISGNTEQNPEFMALLGVRGLA